VTDWISSAMDDRQLLCPSSWREGKKRRGGKGGGKRGEKLGGLGQVRPHTLLWRKVGETKGGGEKEEKGRGEKGGKSRGLHSQFTPTPLRGKGGGGKRGGKRK